ncbi:golgin candidate 5-like [Gossypium australe]|uniref:Golgin candidate 5-like n=1 Tax=Gossypium australe TaxID=47621 RepID=A0A5B6X8F4_9ROSI|nr:golgin candidate 5-like [Gossypium australe]
MAWFSGKVSLGGFPDIAGAVNKFQESVKNIEKNFDNALGFEEKSESSSNEASGLWPSDRKALFDPVVSFMGQKGEENAVESSGKLESSQDPRKAVEKEEAETYSSTCPHEKTSVEDDKAAVKLEKENKHSEAVERADTAISESGKAESEPEPVSTEPSQTTFQNVGSSDSPDTEQQKESFVTVISDDSDSKEAKLDKAEVDQVEDAEPVPAKSIDAVDILESKDEQKTHTEEISDKSSPVKSDESSDRQDDAGAGPDESVLSSSHSISVEETNSVQEFPLPNVLPSYEAQGTVSESVFVGNDEKVEVNEQTNDSETDVKEEMHLSSATIMPASVDSMHELEKVRMEMKMMESALQGAARQAQAKADEIAKLMNENEQLKAVIEDLKTKSNEAEMESLQEEYHQKVSTLERKVYALTKERDTLRREQNKKSDAAALLKEKDEIIKQVMAEGEELSKKQATQESLIRKLRAQIRELEEEKKGLTTKLQLALWLDYHAVGAALLVEENKVESIKKDKTATEKLLQETIEKHQVELAAQKDFYTNALNAAREAEALAEARANNEARTELESRLREAEERESMLVQTLEELRQTLSRKEQQAVFREDMLRRDIEDLQKRYQASERRCEELITQVPESTRPLLRQIEAMQETTSRRAEAWAAVERSLNSRLQEAETKAAAAEEREGSVNERLSQTLSRINVLEAQVLVLWLMYVFFVEAFLDIGLTFALLQISCLRAEQQQLSRSLEKERQRAAEQRQEYLAAKEEADTQEVRANQLEEEIRELRRKHKQELQDALVHQELLQQEVEREKAARADLERTVRVQSTELAPIARHNSTLENGSLSRKLSTTSSIESMEESYYLQASLDSSDGFSEKRNIGETALSPLYMKSMTPSAFESALRQKEGELASYMSRLTSLESIRDSLSEELVKMTAQCEKLKAEAAMLPGIRTELEALRRRHSAALELMGERDEELEELRADIVDLKEMYREQVNLLVNKIQRMNSSAGNTS